MLSGLILAGGQSTRMGRDKAALRLADGRTLLQRQVEVLRAAGAVTVQVSVRPGGKINLGEGVRIIVDSTVDAGPLAGIAAGLRTAPAGLVVVLAVDMPAITAEHLSRLVEMATPACGVVPVVAGQIEPLAAVYPASLASSAEAWLAGGQRAVHAWVKSEAAKGSLLLWETPPDWAGAFRSWNTPQDLPPP
jgi:molybdopterin-guanine dinucleotide biosynthesis protein A